MCTACKYYVEKISELANQTDFLESCALDNPPDIEYMAEKWNEAVQAKLEMQRFEREFQVHKYQCASWLDASCYGAN